MSDAFNCYLALIYDADCLEDLDELMFDCAEDPKVTASEFVKLTAFAKLVISNHGWIG